MVLTFYLKYQPQQIERFYYTREQKLSIDIHPTKCTKSTVCLSVCVPNSVYRFLLIINQE